MLHVFIASATLQNAIFHAFRILPEMTAIIIRGNFHFSVCNPTATTGDSTNHKRLLMQQYL
jgi:hypothetical protein